MSKIIPQIEQAVRHIDGLTVLGFISVPLMLAFYALEQRSPTFVLGFAIVCLMGSLYGFLQWAWPFGLVETIRFVIALRRWWHAETHS